MRSKIWLSEPPFQFLTVNVTGLILARKTFKDGRNKENPFRLDGSSSQRMEGKDPVEGRDEGGLGGRKRVVPSYKRDGANI